MGKYAIEVTTFNGESFFCINGFDNKNVKIIPLLVNIQNSSRIDEIFKIFNLFIESKLGVRHF